MKRLYVGNVGPGTTIEDLREAFSKFGPVISVTFAEDRFSGRRRGFGYVEMEHGDDAAIAGLNRTDLGGQPLTVCGARPKGETSSNGPAGFGGAA
jgi:RNA recognition motif-containing protein